MPRKTPMTVAEAARQSRRAGLEAARDRLAGAIDSGDMPPQALAAAVKEFAAILRELDTLSEPKGSTVDDLARRRASRREGKASAEGSPSPAMGE